MTRFLVKKKPIEIVVELWEGPGLFRIPVGETDGHVDLFVSPGDYVATGVKGERYPLTSSALEQSFECIRELRPDEMPAGR